MARKSKALLYIILYTSPLLIFAQETPTVVSPKPEPLEAEAEPQQSDIYIFSKSTDEGLLLRWAPANSGTWLMGNDHGYTIEKATLDEDENNEFLPISNGSIKPWPLNDWQAIVNENTPYTAAAAMAIHGEVDESKAGKGFVGAARDLDNKYGFALLSADFDRKAAEASGLMYLDKDVNTNTLAVYRIYISSPTLGALSDTTYQLINHTEPEDFIAPYLLDPIEGEKTVTLQWERNPEGGRYTGYYIERSADEGTTFTRTTDEPFLDVTTNLMVDKQYVRFTDNVIKNYEPYHYRIIALDAFGDQSTPSNVVIGMGRDMEAPSSPQNFETEETPEHHVQLTWEYDVEDEDFEGFKIYRSFTPEEDYEAISDLLSSSTRLFIDLEPHQIETNYYYVAAVDTAGNESESVVNFAITSDETPPQAPVNLRYTIDTLGQMLLEWDAPEDKDIRGYLVHYSNAIDEQFAVISGDYIKNNFYVDILNLNTLTENIYYYVIAFDLSYNASVESEVLTVKKPDLIPPSPSVFETYHSSEKGISFSWRRSTSDDVSLIELFRQSEDGMMKKLESFDMNNSRFLDKNIEEGKYYEYELRTTDDDGNTTITEKRLRLLSHKSFYLKDTPVLSAVSEEEGIQLMVEYPDSENFEFKIYRSENDNPLSTYVIFRGIVNYLDKDVYKKINYNYAVKAIGEDGRESKMSETIVTKR